MPHPSHALRAVPRVAAGALVILSLLLQSGAAATIREGGIDPANLGKGDWIYILPNALNNMGGDVPAVTNLSSMMAFLKNQGLQYVIIKAATGDALYPSAGAPQFTAEVVNAGHAAGLKIFGYNRSDGLNVPGEISIADYVFNTGADGFVFDAESEWESQNLPNNTMLATQLCSAVRARWPNKFLAHAPFPIISYHNSFPYKEFGYYCDAVMPQDYWVEIGYTPNYMVTRMSQEWRNWQAGLSGKWTNSIKPIVAAGQGWSSASGTITAAQVTEFVAALKTNASPATAGGYKGVNYWRAELHPLEVWDAIRTNSIGTVPNTAPTPANVSAKASPNSAIITWTTDQNSDSSVEYGLTTGYGEGLTNTAGLWYHTMTISGLSPNTTYHFRVGSRNANNLRGISADFVFTTLAAQVADIIIDNPEATCAGSWSLGNSSADKYGADYNYCTAVSGAATKTATFSPTIVTAGKYDVYVWYPQGGNRSTNAPHLVSYNGGNVTAYVNQTGGGGGWRLIASARDFAAGNSGFVQVGNNSGEGGLAKNVMADAVKFVYVPPPPSAPSIATQPQDRVVTQGDTASFSVVASGTGPLVYQWRFKGSPLPGATDSSWWRVNAGTGDAGDYTVRITNSVGAITSRVAVLSVLVPPAITTDPQSVTAQAGADALFTVAASGTAPLAYQWQFNGNARPGATGTSLTITHAQPADAGTYSVMVSNLAGTATSAEALLTVTAVQPPRIESISIGSDCRPTLTVSGPLGKYAVDAAAGLSEPGPMPWIELATFTATNALFQFIDTQTNQVMRYYRVRALP